MPAGLRLATSQVEPGEEKQSFVPRPHPGGGKLEARRRSGAARLGAKWRPDAIRFVILEQGASGTQESLGTSDSCVPDVPEFSTSFA